MSGSRSPKVRSTGIRKGRRSFSPPWHSSCIVIFQLVISLLIPRTNKKMRSINS